MIIRNVFNCTRVFSCQIHDRIQHYTGICFLCYVRIKTKRFNQICTYMLKLARKFDRFIDKH